jgi:hypothetical protein
VASSFGVVCRGVKKRRKSGSSREGEGNRKADGQKIVMYEAEGVVGNETKSEM